MRLAFTLVGLLASLTALRAQIYSNEFLSVGVGARALAMGNSVVASSTDIYSAYWNPAGLAGVSEETGVLAGAMHAEQFAGVAKYDYIGVSIPLSTTGRRIGLSLIRQGVDDIPNTINLYNPDGTLDYDNVTSFSSADYGVLFSYAQPTKLMKGDLAVGGNLKVVRRIIGEFSSAWGVGLDIGARLERGKWQVGLTLRDATSTYNAWKNNLDDRTKEVLEATNNTLPDVSGSETTLPSILPAVSYRFAYKQLGFSPEVAAWVTFDGERNTLLAGKPVSLDLGTGLEVDYKETVFLRLGVDQWQRYQAPGEESEKLIVRPGLGLGIRLKSVALDYAFSNPGSGNSLYAHVFSLQLALRRPGPARVN